MKTPEEISKKIRENIEHALKRPKMYFANPQSMEDHLSYVTELLSFIHDKKTNNQYGDYLVSKGYQSNSYTNFHKTKVNIDNEEMFSRFGVFFKDFFDTFEASLLK